MPLRNGHPEEIRRKMARIRQALDSDFEGVAREARTLRSWHYYLRRYPLLCIAGAFAIGYFIVPRRLEIRAPDEETLTKLARKRKLVIQPESRQAAPRGVLSGAFNFLFGLAVNGAMTYFGQFLAGVVDRGSKSPPQQSGGPDAAASQAASSPNRRV